MGDGEWLMAPNDAGPGVKALPRTLDVESPEWQYFLVIVDDSGTTHAGYYLDLGDRKIAQRPDAVYASISRRNGEVVATRSMNGPWVDRGGRRSVRLEDD